MTFMPDRRDALASMRRFLRDERGATAVEYGLLVGGIGVVIMTVIFAVGQGIRETLFDRVSAVLAQSN